VRLRSGRLSAVGRTSLAVSRPTTSALTRTPYRRSDAKRPRSCGAGARRSGAGTMPVAHTQAG
jgi:hypothetical protein